MRFRNTPLNAVELANVQRKQSRGLPGTVTPEEIDGLLLIAAERDALLAWKKRVCLAVGWVNWQMNEQ
jgi:uncharacterized membrane protein (UPF0127 family)